MQKCLAEVGPEHIEWTCKECGKRKAAEISDYTEKILRMQRLRKAGYRFDNNDLSPEEWEDLASAEEFMAQQEHKKNQQELIKALRQALRSK